MFTKITCASSLQETVPAGRRTYTARELKSGTDYLVTVIAQYPNSVGESVSAKQRTSEWEVENVNVSKGNTLIRLTICCLSLYIRVFARGVQPTSSPSRLLLSISGLGSAHVSCARLQTHLRTTRSGTHTPLYLVSVHLYLSFFPCLPPVLHVIYKNFLFLNAAGGVGLILWC